ncbi:MAG: Cobyrinic acid ac-diamide synthase [Parcubacteria group bacterium GW2011_GWD2_38_11]|nr:MAG: Cobyrinic acid ac-diamide synthase [Parcubacteria group bacterium GW2011_GWD2_38_11]
MPLIFFELEKQCNNLSILQYKQMAKIISLINQKGGVGKTTTAINIATYLASMGKLVLLVDLDPQGNASSGLGVDIRNLEKGLYSTLVGGDHPRNVIIRAEEAGHDLLPSSQDLAGAGVEMVHFDNREFKLYDVLRQIRTDYDYIIIDSPPSLGLLTINGLVASDEVLIPVQTEYYALEGLSQLLQTIELVQKHLQPNLKIMGAVLTMYDRRNRLARQVVKEMRNHFPGHVFESVIPRSVRLAEAPSYGKSILSFDSLSKGARSYKNLVKEMVARDDEEKRNKIQ